MELEQGLIFPPHDIAVKYKKPVRTLFFGEEEVDEDQYNKLFL